MCCCFSLPYKIDSQYSVALHIHLIHIILLYSWLCYLRGFFKIPEVSYSLRRKTLILMYYCWFLCILFWIFEVSLVISETPPCLLSLVKTLRPLEVLRLLTSIAKTSMPLGNPLFLSNRFYANLWHFVISLGTFSGFMGCVPVLRLYCLFPVIVFFVCLVFCICIILCRCCCCVFVLVF
jgi:hypothetical protein